MLTRLASIILFCVFFVVVPTGVAILYDYFHRYKKAKRKYQRQFSHCIGRHFIVVDQDALRGSVLDNNLSLGDVYQERGVIEYGFAVGDEIKILPYPKFQMFSSKKVFFER